MHRRMFEVETHIDFDLYKFFRSHCGYPEKNIHDAF